MQSFPQKFVCMFCLAVLGAFGVRSPAAQTLREALAQRQVRLAEAGFSNLDQKITSGAELDDASQFVIAYYLDDGTASLKPPLYIHRFDRKTATWQSGTLGENTAGASQIDSSCFGAVLDITALGEQLILETHINPSAGCVLIVSKDLKLTSELNGWVLGHFNDGTIVYHRSQVHFATVHPAEVAVYNQKSKKDFTLFPPQPDSPVRGRLAAELRDFFRFHGDYCAKANDPCDPEMFDSEVQQNVAIGDREHALVFAVSYELQGYGQDEEKPSGPGHVIYVYRNADDESKVEYRELLPEDIKSRFGDVSLQDLLDPQRLKTIFQH